MKNIKMISFSVKLLCVCVCKPLYKYIWLWFYRNAKYVFITGLTLVPVKGSEFVMVFCEFCSLIVIVFSWFVVFGKRDFTFLTWLNKGYSYVVRLTVPPAGEIMKNTWIQVQLYIDHLWPLTESKNKSKPCLHQCTFNVQQV